MNTEKKLTLSRGGWTDSSSGRTSNVLDKKTEQVIATVPALTHEEIKQAIACSYRAFLPWKDSTAALRSQLLSTLGDYLLKHSEHFATIITKEQGKPRSEALAEVLYSADYMKCYSEECLNLAPEVIPNTNHSKRLFAIRRPIGVVAAITPWNFPLAMLARKLAAALAAGCTFIAKPAPETPLSALALGEACCKAGIPTDVVQIITGDAELIGGEFMKSTLVRALSFTGSTEVGKLLIQQSATTVKKLTLELGGNAPCIVCKDTDLDSAMTSIAYGKYRNAGQTCVSINRFLIHEEIAEEFINRLSAHSASLRIYKNDCESYDIAPLINKAAVQKVSRLVDDALKKGAVLSYGTPPDCSKNTQIVTPCILTNVTPEMALWREEIFGPICAITTFSTTEEAIRLANSTDYGLAAYVYSADNNSAIAIASELECGMVGINDTAISNAAAPFGGIKQSGYGREGGRYGIEEYLELQYQSISN